MWNNAVADLHAGLHEFLAMAQSNPTMMGIAVVVGLLALMLAAEIVDGRATATRVDEAPHIKLRR